MSDFFFLSRSVQVFTSLTVLRHSPTVLTDDLDLHDDIRDDAGNVTSPASGLVRALRDEQIPVCVLERSGKADDVAGWERRMADVAVAQTDWVTVADWESVRGLERRVVGLSPRDDDPYFSLFALSRCTTQLIIMDRPPDDSQTDTSDSAHYSETSDSVHYSHTSSEDSASDEDESKT